MLWIDYIKGNNDTIMVYDGKKKQGDMKKYIATLCLQSY